MRLELLYESRILKEYELDHVLPDRAWEASRKDPNTTIIVYDPATGEFLTGLEHQTSHSNLIYKMREKYLNSKDADVRAAAYRLEGGAARAYWIPSTGDLFLYQMDAPSRLASVTIDPPSDVISKIIDSLDVGSEVVRIAVIE